MHDLVVLRVLGEVLSKVFPILPFFRDGRGWECEEEGSLL